MNKTAVKYGVFTGFAVIAYLFAFYFYDKTLMRSAAVLWSTVVIYFIGMFMATVSIHRNRGTEEELSFRKMIATPFIVFLITNAYYIFFLFWIMNVYDLEFLELHQALSHQEHLELYEGKEGIAEIRKMKPEDYTPTFGGSFKRYIFGILGGFPLAFIIGMVVRRT